MIGTTAGEGGDGNFQLLCHACSTQVILLGRNSYIKVFIDHHGYKQVSKIGIFHVNFVPFTAVAICYP